MMRLGHCIMNNFYIFILGELFISYKVYHRGNIMKKQFYNYFFKFWWGGYVIVCAAGQSPLPELRTGQELIYYISLPSSSGSVI